MKKYRYLFFDLDGTVINSFEGIANSLEKMFSHYGMSVDRAEMNKFIGPPLYTSFKEYFEAEDIEEAVRVFRSFYLPDGIREHSVYPEIDEVIKSLKERGYKIFMATSKAEFAAVELLKDDGLYSLFDRVFGADATKGRKEKEDVLKYAFDELKIDKESSVMIGDTVYDIAGSKIIGIDCIAVLYGFGDKEELLSNGVVATVETPSQLLDILK